MIDSLGRNINYLRLSVTDKCNFRCKYCMPRGNNKFSKECDLLTFDEIIRIVKILKELGIEKVRLTGGEPLLRENLPILIKRLHDEAHIEKTPITTNGFLLKDYAKSLYDVGVRDFNISLDAIDKSILIDITNCEDSVKVFDGIDELIRLRHEHGDINIKLNVVPMDTNINELSKLIEYAIEKNITLRFIELMPIGIGHEYKCIKENDILKILDRDLYKKYNKLNLIDNDDTTEKCRYYKYDNIDTKIGFISSISHKFCDKCNRIRLTANGFLKTCLQYNLGIDLKKILNESDEYILLEIKNAIINKPKGHHFNKMIENNDELKKMNEIGG